MATHSSILAWRIPLDRGSWRATVHRVAKTRTRLKDSAQTHIKPVLHFLNMCIRVKSQDKYQGIIINKSIGKLHPCHQGSGSFLFLQRRQTSSKLRPKNSAHQLIWHLINSRVICSWSDKVGWHVTSHFQL